MMSSGQRADKKRNGDDGRRRVRKTRREEELHESGEAEAKWILDCVTVFTK
jgi:hypothetical protein